ncbi:hypothetical protein QYF61_018427 [Mycteria americana]|uniref:Uncharacterized protein n=1 Tax=Mycteria americana TaxID=33587 RepID=A0AAN7MM83_MYCAM|nr:hypothetical protein QYF61_018427 [Mycteria americana]
MLGKTVWVTPASGKGKPIRGIAFAQGPGCTWWVMRKDGEVRCVPQGDLILGVNGQITTHPLVRAKLILSNGRTIRPTLLLGPCNILGVDVLKGQSWVDSWGKCEIGTPPSLPHSLPCIDASLTVNLLQTAASLPHSKLVNIPQYKLPSDAICPVTELIKELEEQGIIVKSHSPYNSSICPVKKPNGKWQLTVDYRTLNAAIETLIVSVPSKSDIVNFLNENAFP